MKSFLLFVLTCLTAISLHAQTEEQVNEWMEKIQIAIAQGNYQEGIIYCERIKDVYEKQKLKKDKYKDFFFP